jgi:hypothetical protein
MNCSFVVRTSPSRTLLCQTRPEPPPVKPGHRARLAKAPPRARRGAPSNSRSISMATAQQEGNPDYAQFLAVALQAAREAGAVIADAWDKAKQVEHKGAPPARDLLGVAAAGGCRWRRSHTRAAAAGTARARGLPALGAPAADPGAAPPPQAPSIWSRRLTSGARRWCTRTCLPHSPRTGSLGRRSRRRRASQTSSLTTPPGWLTRWTVSRAQRRG